MKWDEFLNMQLSSYAYYRKKERKKKQAKAIYPISKRKVARAYSNSGNVQHQFTGKKERERIGEEERKNESNDYMKI